MELNDAAAFYKLGLLTYTKLKDYSSKWLDHLDYSDRLYDVHQDPSMSQSVSPAFEHLLHEREIDIPSEEEAVRIVLKYYLRMIVQGECDAFEGMKFIDSKLYSRIHPLHPGEEFAGQCLGLEHMYTWYRELQDAEDGSAIIYYTDLPKEEAVQKFKNHLQQEAKKLLETKYP
jgi:hypothetical protein